MREAIGPSEALTGALDAAANGTLAFEVGLDYGDARFVDTRTGEEIVYWDQQEFADEPELFHGLLQRAIELGADVRKMGESPTEGEEE